MPVYEAYKKVIGLICITWYGISEQIIQQNKQDDIRPLLVQDRGTRESIGGSEVGCEYHWELGESQCTQEGNGKVKRMR